MFLGDQYPENMAGQKSSMISTLAIKSCFHLVLYLCPAACSVWDKRDTATATAQNNAAAHLRGVSYMGCWAGVIAAHSADLRCGLL